ncbi:MAG: diacylglycerol kinase [Pseudomonadota bacterium]
MRWQILLFQRSSELFIFLIENQPVYLNFAGLSLQLSSKPLLEFVKIPSPVIPPIFRKNVLNFILSIEKFDTQGLGKASVGCVLRTISYNSLYIDKKVRGTHPFEAKVFAKGNRLRRGNPLWLPAPTKNGMKVGAILYGCPYFYYVIEAVADCLTPERHPLIKRAKDAGSAAVLIALCYTVLVWGLVLWS